MNRKSLVVVKQKKIGLILQRLQAVRNGLGGAYLVAFLGESGDQHFREGDVVVDDKKAKAV